MRTIPRPDELKTKFSTQQPQVDALEAALYDHILYPAAGQAQLVLFALPIGQGIATALGAPVGSTKTINDTNMKAAGSISTGEGFLVEGVAAHFYPGLSAAANTFTAAVPSVFAAAAAAAVAAQVNDIATFYLAGSLKLTVGQKTFVEDSPLMLFPPRTRMEADAAMATNSATVGEVAVVNMRAGGIPYHVAPFSLLPNVAFSVQLNYPSGVVAMPSGFNGRVGVRLHGLSYRNVQ